MDVGCAVDELVVLELGGGATVVLLCVADEDELLEQ